MWRSLVAPRCAGAHARWTLNAVVRSLALVTLAAVALAVIAYGVWWLLDDALGRSLAAQVVSLSAALVAGGSRLSARLSRARSA